MAKAKSSEVISMDEVKRWLRRALVRERQAISKSDRIRWSKAAVNHLLRSSYYKKAKVVASFIGFGSEIITDGLIERAWKDGKKVLIPITSKGFKNPYFALFQKGDALHRTSFGPFELVEKKTAFSFRLIDLVVVPGLGFDQYGTRLGYGGGVYDRMLQKTPRANHVGLFYSCQGMPVLPKNRFDKKMDAIVTENGL